MSLTFVHAATSTARRIMSATLWTSARYERAVLVQIIGSQLFGFRYEAAWQEAVAEPPHRATLPDSPGRSLRMVHDQTA